jgi:hypothetical protein
MDSKLYEILTDIWLTWFADEIPIEIEDLFYILSFIMMILIFLSPLLIVFGFIWVVKSLLRRGNYD